MNVDNVNDRILGGGCLLILGGGVPAHDPLVVLVYYCEGGHPVRRTNYRGTGVQGYRGFGAPPQGPYGKAGPR